ncbi:hypothetical protein C8Q80DRAFT_1167459 [Daedaleopsis nitida]|nr:hypothetical protein C8Q80DRAFT_1167459 [Daedaleopsis nitida]
MPLQTFLLATILALPIVGVPLRRRSEARHHAGDGHEKHSYPSTPCSSPCLQRGMWTRSWTWRRRAPSTRGGRPDSRNSEPSLSSICAWRAWAVSEAMSYWICRC